MSHDTYIQEKSASIWSFDTAASPVVTRDSFPDYVLAEIARTTGPQPPCRDAAEVLAAFWDRLGAGDAMTVCTRAFGPHAGFWRGAPVTPLRFRPSHDGFFARPLLAEAADE